MLPFVGSSPKYAFPHLLVAVLPLLVVGGVNDHLVEICRCVVGLRGRLGQLACLALFCEGGTTYLVNDFGECLGHDG